MAKGKKAAAKPKKLQDKMRAAYKDYIGKDRKEADRCPNCDKCGSDCEC